MLKSATKISTERAEITEEELKSLTAVISNKYGIDFTNYEIKSLTRGFARIMNKHKFESLIDLWTIIMKDRQFLNECIDDLTVNLTEFFRNDSLWIWLKEHLSENYTSFQPMRIWHAACASGEESFSFAFLLNKLGYQNFNIKGTDLSESSIAKAKEGEYTAVFFRKYESALKKVFPDSNIQDMYDDHGNFFSIKSHLAKTVKFSTGNLISDNYGSNYDFIFCRNVMIYFDTNLKIKVLEKMYESLADDGKLIIGCYDSLPEAAYQYFQPLSSEHKVFIKA